MKILGKLEKWQKGLIIVIVCAIVVLIIVGFLALWLFQFFTGFNISLLYPFDFFAIKFAVTRFWILFFYFGSFVIFFTILLISRRIISFSKIVIVWFVIYLLMWIIVAIS